MKTMQQPEIESLLKLLDSAAQIQHDFARAATTLERKMREQRALSVLQEARRLVFGNYYAYQDGELPDIDTVKAVQS